MEGCKQRLIGLLPRPRWKEPVVPEIALESQTCPTPRTHHEFILLGHGSGGRMTADLIRKTFLPHLGNEILAALEDQATLRLAGINGTRHRLAFTTDAFVVRPIF